MGVIPPEQVSESDEIQSTSEFHNLPQLVFVFLKRIRVMAKPGFIPANLKPWIEARQRFRLSHAEVQMARELGMNPKNLGSTANHRQESWKVSLPQFIVQCYERRFRRTQPADVRSIEEKEAERRTRKSSDRPNLPASSTDRCR